MQSQPPRKSALSQFASAIYGFFRAPRVAETTSHSHQGKLLSAGLNCWLLVLCARAVAVVFLGDNPRQQFVLLSIVSLNFLLTLGLRALMHSGFFKVATYGLLILVWLATTLALLQLNAPFAPLAASFVLLIVMAGVLQGRRVAVIAAIMAAMAIGWIAWRAGTGSLPAVPVPWQSSLLVFLTIIFATATFVDLAIGEIILNTQRAEASLRASRVADAANLAKTEFLAHVSHELRTPLNGILGFSEHLKSRITDPALRESASIIHASGQHLLALVNSLLDLSQLESGKTTLNLGWLQLRPLMQETAGLHGAAAAAKTLSFQLEVADSLPETVYSDATKLRQILNNLCHNAVKFTSSGGIVLSASPRENGIEFQVRDTGPGIDPRFLPHLFERFQQHDDFNSRPHGGAGLGLALSREFTEMLGGRISVDSRPGEGSTFTIWLPNSGDSAASPS